MATTYTVTGRAMTLDEQTSRSCGHLAEIDGTTPDGYASNRARAELRRDAQLVANSLRKSVEIYATSPAGKTWLVDVVEVQS